MSCNFRNPMKSKIIRLPPFLSDIGHDASLLTILHQKAQHTSILPSQTGISTFMWTKEHTTTMKHIFKNSGNSVLSSYFYIGQRIKPNPFYTDLLFYNVVLLDKGINKGF